MSLKVSIFTPSHDSKYLDQLYESIKDQDFYEWIILLNNEAEYQNDDDRVKIYYQDSTGDNYVGTLKRLVCGMCKGDILLEVDHDDLLMPNAIEKVKEAFKDPEVGFVYSNTANFKGDLEKAEKYNKAHGWEYKEVEYKEHKLDSHISFKPTPASVSRIWYAPNHLRAWRSDVYWDVGGHKDMKVLDDLDLLCRTAMYTKIKHIDECLYLYRIDNNNTWLKNNREIQDNVMRICRHYIEPMAIKWAERNDLQIVDMGGRFNPHQDYKSVDLKDADIIGDLNENWKFQDESVGVVRAYDVFEHLEDPIHTMKELYRVLAPGGYAFIQVPSTDGRGAFQDPTHKSFWNENSFLYYTHQNWAKYIDTPVRFQAMDLYTTQPNDMGVSWVKAILIKLKDNRPPGIINI